MREKFLYKHHINTTCKVTIQFCSEVRSPVENPTFSIIIRANSQCKLYHLYCCNILYIVALCCPPQRSVYYQVKKRGKSLKWLPCPPHHHHLQHHHHHHHHLRSPSPSVRPGNAPLYAHGRRGSGCALLLL